MKNAKKTTLQVASDRANIPKEGVIPREMARGVWIERPPGAAATKCLHMMIDHAAGRMADECWHEMHLRDIRKVRGMRNHDLGSLREIVYEIAAATFSFEVDVDQQRRKVGIGTFLESGELVYYRHDEGDLIFRWRFGYSFRELARESNHWAILDRQAFYLMKSRYSLALFQHISSSLRLRHLSSETLSIEQLRAVLGIGAGKLKRWTHLHRDALKPAISEINKRASFDVEMRLIKAGRRVKAVELFWAEKPDKRITRLENERHSAGRSARDAGTVETPAVAFPGEGSIAFDTRWQTLKRAAGCNMDNTMIAEKFRGFCASRKIRLDARNIEKVFNDFCATVGRV